MNKLLVALLFVPALVEARITSPFPTNPDIVCFGPVGNETCLDNSGNLVPTTSLNQDLGSSSLKWNNLTIGNNATVNGTLTVGTFVSSGVANVAISTFTSATGVLSFSTSTTGTPGLQIGSDNTVFIKALNLTGTGTGPGFPVASVTSTGTNVFAGTAQFQSSVTFNATSTVTVVQGAVANFWVMLASQTINYNAPVTTITFNVPTSSSSYKFTYNLMLSTGSAIFIRFNNDGNKSYAAQCTSTTGSCATSGGLTGVNNMAYAIGATADDAITSRPGTNMFQTSSTTASGYFDFGNEYSSSTVAGLNYVSGLGRSTYLLYSANSNGVQNIARSEYMGRYQIPLAKLSSIQLTSWDGKSNVLYVSSAIITGHFELWQSPFSTFP